MRVRITWVLLAMLMASTMVVAQRVEVREEILSNGMKILMVERHEAPTIACGWVAHVGSVNERPGITGISHLFEHMMFKGTNTIGIKDYEKGMEIQQQQDAVRAKMEIEYSKLRKGKLRGDISGNIYALENMTPELEQLRSELEELFKKEKELIVKDEMDQIYTREGGAGLNAFTTEDQTAYIINVPSNKLELWFWMESDRLLNPVFREFYSERDVVREERRMRVESTPTGELEEQFTAMFWQSSPYNWPVIGWATDVEFISRAHAEEYFDIFYAPNNITAVLIGDFDSDHAMTLARQYFERIPRGKTDPPEVITFEIDQKGEKRMSGEAETNPQVSIRFHAPAFNHKDTFALQMLADVLTGRTGRLYKSLVERFDIAVGEPFASLRLHKYAGAFQLGAQVKQGRIPAEVEVALLLELDKLKEKPIEERELQKIKNKSMADSFRRLQSNFFLLFQLLLYDSYGDWRIINDSVAKIQAVTAEDIQKVANKYLTIENRNVAVWTRKAGTAQEDPFLASLPPQAQRMIKPQLALIMKETEVSKLQSTITQAENSLETVPDQLKPSIEYMIQKMKERIQQLESVEKSNDSSNKGGE